MATPLRIWHVGNWCIQLGQTYIESPFKSEIKDVELLNYARPFVDALRAIPGAEVVSQPSWELYHLSPEAFDERLRWATTSRRATSGRPSASTDHASRRGSPTDRRDALPSASAC